MPPINEISTSALAYLGDCVMELCVRERLVGEGISHSGQLNSAALQYVTATRQADAVKRILPLLTEEEERYYKRGRNSGHLNIPKSARPMEYRMATGMEVLFGYLHLTEQTERLRRLFEWAYPRQDRASVQEEKGKEEKT